MSYRTIHNPGVRLAIVLSAFVAATSLPAQAAEEFKLTAGYDYTSGKYGQDVTTVIEKLPVTLNRLTGPWSLKLTVPYIRVTGNGAVVPGPGGPTSFDSFDSGFFGSGGGGGATANKTVTNSGLGDVEASVGYTLFPASGSFYEVTAKVKFGTAAADKGLGTGENDYFLQFDGVLGNGDAAPFFTVGYIVTGDSAGFVYKDVPYGTLGLMFKSEPSGNVGLSYDYRQATVDGTDDLQQVSVFSSWRDSAGWSTTLSALIGLTNSSPDYGVSLMFTRTD